MSRRTAESIRQYLLLGIRNKNLFQKGKGTREWTPQQQQDILDKGKAYDEDGVAFQGQHMKSAEMYPNIKVTPETFSF